MQWQRMISSTGRISSLGPGKDGAQRQREALDAEDVEVRVGRANDELLVPIFRRMDGSLPPPPGTVELAPGPA